MTDILSREAWGATVPLRTDDHGRPVLVKTPAAEAWLHHSVTSPDDDGVYEATDDVARDMRELERIGKARFGLFSYSWAHHPSGWVGEGAGLTVGAHTAGRNSTSFGLVCIGNYQVNEPSQVMLESVASLLADLVRAGKLRPDFRWGGHQQAPGAATACPGSKLLARLGWIRQRVTDLLTPPILVPSPAPAATGFPNAVGAVLRPGGGVWVLGADGGVGAYPDWLGRTPPFLGSLPGLGVVATATALLPTPTGQGYWVQTTDGGIFTFGDAAFHGSYPSLGPTQPPRRFVGLQVREDQGPGYLQLASDGAGYAWPNV